MIDHFRGVIAGRRVSPRSSSSSSSIGREKKKEETRLETRSRTTNIDFQDFSPIYSSVFELMGKRTKVCVQCRISFLCLHGLAASAPSPPRLAQTPQYIMNQKEHEKTPRSVVKLCFSLLLSSIDRNHLLPIRTNVSALSFQQAQAPIFKYPLSLHRPRGAISSRFPQAVW
jgi:hypothetical protein